MAAHAAAPAPPAVPDIRDPDATPAAFSPTPLATGSQQLVRSYKSTLGRGLASAIALHGLALGTYWFAVSNAAPPATLTDVVFTTETVAPPPPIDAPVTPPDAPPPPSAPAAPVATGIPVPVVDAPPEATIPANGEVFDDLGGPGTGLPSAGTGDGFVIPEPPPLPQPPPLPPTPREQEDDPDRVYVTADQMPLLIGGLASIRPVYPEMERAAGVEGRVFLQFVVNEDGSVSEVTVTRSASPGLDAAAVAAVRQARFQPGMQRGRAVKVQFSLPVNFRLD